MRWIDGCLRTRNGVPFPLFLMTEELRSAPKSRFAAISRPNPSMMSRSGRGSPIPPVARVTSTAILPPSLAVTLDSAGPSCCVRRNITLWLV